ncbi:MAG TPA: hypothetical protein VG692_13540 [Gemmatimonadales bacterium]|nr:hypothetical protein [Gemmatimonadales bacterium]
MTTPVLLAWSGGKDSSLTLAALRIDPAVRVMGLLTTVAPAYDRVSIHGVRRSILHAQAAALGLPVFEASLAPASSNADYDRAWAEALGAARRALGPVTDLAYGDLFLEDVRAFREDQARRLAYTPRFPLWGMDTVALARRFVDEGFEAYLTCVDTTQLDGAFAGRRFDHALLRDLPASVDPCGERGEFHTCVVDGPIFASRIAVRVGERVRRDQRFEYCDLVPVAETPGAVG